MEGELDLPCGQFEPGFEPTPPPDVNPVPDGGVVLPPLPTAGLSKLPGVEPPIPTPTPNPNPPIPPVPPPNPNPRPAITPNPIPPGGPGGPSKVKWYCTYMNGVRMCRAFTDSQAKTLGLDTAKGHSTEAACKLTCVNTPPPTPLPGTGFGSNGATTPLPVPSPQPGLGTNTSITPTLNSAFSTLEDQVSLQTQSLIVPNNSEGNIHNSNVAPVQTPTNIYKFENDKVFVNINGEMVEIPDTLNIGSTLIRTNNFLLSKNTGSLAALDKELYYDLESIATSKPTTTEFKALTNSRYSYLLNSSVDESIIKILSEIDNEFFNFENVSNLSLEKLDLSLKESIKTVLKNLRTSIGLTVEYKYLCESIKNFLLEDNLISISAESLRKLQKGTLVDSQDLRILRNIKPSLLEIISYILTNMRSIDPDKYNNRGNKNFLSNWWTQPLELFESIPLLSSSGILEFPVTNDYLCYGISGAQEVTVSSTEDHTYFLENGVTDTRHNLSNSYVLSNFDKDLVFHWIDEPNVVTLEATNSSSGIEFSSITESVPEQFYLFQLDPTSISNKITKNIVNNITANYTLVSSYSSIDEFIRRKAAPWKILYVSVNDPITAYFDVADSNYTFKFKDITLSDVGGQYGTDFIVPTVPSFIVILTTDKFENNIFGAESELLERYETTEPSAGVYQVNLNQPTFNTRRIGWGSPVLTENINLGLTTPLKSYYYVTKGVNSYGEVVDTQKINFRFDSNNEYYLSSHNYNSTPISKIKSGIKAYTDIVEDLKASNSIDTSGIISFEILSRMPALQYYKFLKISDKIINNLNRSVLDTRVMNKTYNLDLVSDLSSLNYNTKYGSN